MKNLLVKLFGWKAAILHGDPTSYDRWKWLAKHLKRGPFRTLDAGCGSGAYTLYAATIGNESLGISFDKLNNELATQRAKLLGINNVKFIQWDLRELSKIINDLGTFDQIICFETIEHILNDDLLISNFLSLLKPGGCLLITTPYKYYKRRSWDKLSDYEDGGHVRWGYTHEEMKVLLSKHGLETIIEDYISGIISQQISNLQSFLGNLLIHPIPWIIVFPLRVLQLFDRTLTQMIKYPYISIGVVAMKH